MTRPRTLPKTPHLSIGQVHNHEGHPLPHGRLNSWVGGDCRVSQYPMPEPLRRNIRDACGASLPVSPVGNVGGRHGCHKIGEGDCTHAGGVLGRVLGQVICLADNRSNPQGGYQVLLWNKFGEVTVEGYNRDHLTAANRSNYLSQQPTWLPDGTRGAEHHPRRSSTPCSWISISCTTPYTRTGVSTSWWDSVWDIGRSGCCGSIGLGYGWLLSLAGNSAPLSRDTMG